jgi:hypothetical protein
MGIEGEVLLLFALFHEFSLRGCVDSPETTFIKQMLTSYYLGSKWKKLSIIAIIAIIASMSSKSYVLFFISALTIA